jgi:serine O-acetyltransferase
MTRTYPSESVKRHETFKECCRAIRSDLNFYAHVNNEPLTLKNKLTTIFFNVSFQLLCIYRLGHYFQGRRSKLSLLTLPLWRWQTKLAGSQISFSAHLGKHIRLPHPLGIVIGEGVVIKDSATLFQQVTLGSHGQVGKRAAYPVVEKNATLYAGAKVIGAVRIGEGATVGANAVVNRDIPDYATAVGVPAKIIKQKTKHPTPLPDSPPLVIQRD